MQRKRDAVQDRLALHRILHPGKLYPVHAARIAVTPAAHNEKGGQSKRRA
jgi:hypothetical protein